MSSLYLANETGERTVVLSGAQIDISVDALQMAFTLTEAQRVLSIENSATPGGDDTVDIEALESAILDIGQKRKRLPARNSFNRNC